MRLYASSYDPNMSIQSMSAPLRKVAMRRPGAILSADPARWHYGGVINAEALNAQFNILVGLVEQSGAEIVWLDGPNEHGADDDLADSVFTYDPSLMTDAGAVLLRMGKPLRMAETELHRALYDRENIPILGEISAPGTIEGGDCFFLDAATLAVGRGFRTNQSGIDQLAALIEPHGIRVESYDLPYFSGPDACVHLMSLVSPLDDDLAIVYAPLFPTSLYQRMTEMGYTLLHTPADEFESTGGLNLNVLATGPRQVIAMAGYPKTAALMAEAGCRVSLFDADQLCLPCEGGPTCLTRPLVRD